MTFATALLLILISSAIFSWFFSMQFNKYAMKLWGDQQDEFFDKYAKATLEGFEAINKRK